MLVLTRKYGEKIMIGDNITITILEARGDAVRVGIEAPPGVSLKRAEVYEQISAENQSAAAPIPGTEETLRDALGHLGNPTSATTADAWRLAGS